MVITLDPNDEQAFAAAMGVQQAALKKAIADKAEAKQKLEDAEEEVEQAAQAVLAQQAEEAAAKKKAEDEAAEGQRLSAAALCPQAESERPAAKTTADVMRCLLPLTFPKKVLFRSSALFRLPSRCLLHPTCRSLPLTSARVLADHRAVARAAACCRPREAAREARRAARGGGDDHQIIRGHQELLAHHAHMLAVHRAQIAGLKTDAAADKTEITGLNRRLEELLDIMDHMG